MSVELVAFCDICETVIKNPNDGFVVTGNVGVADISQSHKDLIGNNIPEPSEDGTIMANEINKQYFCKSCLCKALNILCVSVRNNYPYVPKPIGPIGPSLRTVGDYFSR